MNKKEKLGAALKSNPEIKLTASLEEQVEKELDREDPVDGVEKVAAAIKKAKHEDT